MKRPDMLALIPLRPGAPIRQCRNLIDRFLISESETDKQKEWKRIRLAWLKDNAIVQKSGMMWRVKP